MKKKNISAFTILELVMTTVMVAVILVVVPIVVLKKSTKSNSHKKWHSIAKCTSGNCIFNFKDSILTVTDDITGEAKPIQIYNYKKTTKELYEIRLIGGGGSGTTNSYGLAGEDKKIYMFSLAYNKKANAESGGYNGILSGYYLLETGSGGNNGHSGKPSRFCIIPEEKASSNPNQLKCSESYAIMLAAAQGGITSNEVENDFKCGDLRKKDPNQLSDSENNVLSEKCSGSANTDEEESEFINNKEYCDDNLDCKGDGGNKNNDGINGIVIIK